MKAKDVFSIGHDRMLAIGHRTFWFEGDGEGNAVFMFYTYNTETAQKVKECLAAHQLLCDTDLGSLPAPLAP